MTTNSPSPGQNDREDSPPQSSVPRGYLSGRWFSLRAALSGAAFTLRSQPNARIELVAIAVVAVAGWWLKLTRVEWAVLGLTVTGILALEAINTAIEATVDLVSPQYHPLAKRAKDTAAGAMVFAVLGSLWVALWLLAPRLWQRLF